MKFELMISSEWLVPLNQIAAVHAERAAERWKGQLAAVHALASPGERRRALARLRAERQQWRRDGQYFDTRSALVAYYVRAELERRGWAEQTWRPVPIGESSMPGRRWGVTNADWTAYLSVSLPDEDGELLRRATWHVSAPATRRLQQIAAMRGSLPRPVLDERARLRREVVTAPDLIRSALHDLLAAERSPN